MLNLSQRMNLYERSTQHYLPLNTYSVIRLDGCGFRNFTAKMNKPFDVEFQNSMIQVAEHLCDLIQGSFGYYTCSDEISIFTFDSYNESTEAFYGGRIQKLVSVTASMATSEFSRTPSAHWGVPYFDSRVFPIALPHEVVNYVFWRNMEYIRNSVSALALTHFSPKELQGYNKQKRIEMLEEKEIFWHGLTSVFKYGKIIFGKEDPIVGSYDLAPLREQLLGKVPCFNESI